MSAVKGTKETSASTVSHPKDSQVMFYSTFIAFLTSSSRVPNLEKSSLLDGSHFKVFQLMLTIMKVKKKLCENRKT